MPGPRFRLHHAAPGCMCRCGHREGSHNDLSRCCADECSCGGYPHAPREMWGGFDPVDGPCAEKNASARALRDLGRVLEPSEQESRDVGTSDEDGSHDA